MEKQQTVGNQVTESSISRSLGKDDTFSQEDVESDTHSNISRNNKRDKYEPPWRRVINRNREVRSEDFKVEYVKPVVEGVAVIEAEEINTTEEDYQFALLGCFAGRFPGMKNIISLTKSWGIDCWVAAKPNDFVLLKFRNSIDRDSILNGPDQFLFGRRLILRKLPEKYKLQNSDFCERPLWVKFPGLPQQFWNPRALSKIASCIGKPLSVDRVTKEMNRSSFARMLIEVDNSDLLPETISIRVGDKTLSQEVELEFYPIYCPICCGWDHLQEDCRNNRRMETSRLPTDHTDDNSIHRGTDAGGESQDKKALERQSSSEQSQSVESGNTVERGRKLGKNNDDRLPFDRAIRELEADIYPHLLASLDSKIRKNKHHKTSDRDTNRREVVLKGKEQSRSTINGKTFVCAVSGGGGGTSMPKC